MFYVLNFPLKNSPHSFVFLLLLLWIRRYHALLSRSGPGLDPRSRQISRLRFFSGFFLTCKTNVWKHLAPKDPQYHLAEWVREWCVTYFMFVLPRRWPRHWADPSSGEALHVLV